MNAAEAETRHGAMTGTARSDLDAALLAAHGRHDLPALITLYARAADAVPGARAFYLTQAYVFALEAGDDRAAPLKSRLVAEGADHDDAP